MSNNIYVICDIRSTFKQSKPDQAFIRFLLSLKEEQVNLVFFAEDDQPQHVNYLRSNRLVVDDSSNFLKYQRMHGKGLVETLNSYLEAVSPTSKNSNIIFCLDQREKNALTQGGYLRTFCNGVVGVALDTQLSIDTIKAFIKTERIRQTSCQALLRYNKKRAAEPERTGKLHRFLSFFSGGLIETGFLRDEKTEAVCKLLSASNNNTLLDHCYVAALTSGDLGKKVAENNAFKEILDLANVRQVKLT